MVPPKTGGVTEDYTGDGIDVVAVRVVRAVRRPIWVKEAWNSERRLRAGSWQLRRHHHLCTPEAL